MAGRYNYSGGRGGSSSMYRYNEPSIPQYESFFNPIPLEFVQQNLQQHQQKYDVGYGEALAAKDMYGGAEVSENDIANKNNIVNEFTNNMDTMVKEKYGGDWGRASKEVARMVTNVRQNPFWDTAKILKERQEEARKLKSQYGSEALIFNDLTGRGSIDPATGKTITPDQLQYDIRKRGDWAGSIDDLLKTMNPDKNTWGLSQSDFGYLKSGDTTKITPEGIAKLAEDKSVQQAILSANPDMRDAFEKLPGEREKWFGANHPDLNTAVQELIKGRGRFKTFRQDNDQFHRDIIGEENRAAQATVESAFGPERETAVVPTGYGTSDKEKRQLAKSIFGGNGNLQDMSWESLEPYYKRMAERIGSTSAYTHEFDASETPESFMAKRKQEWEEYKRTPEHSAKVQARDQAKDIVTHFRQNNVAAAKGKSDQEVYEMFLNDRENKYKKAIHLTVPVMNTSILKGMGEATASAINDVEFYFDDGTLASRDWNGKKGIGETTGLPYVAFQEMLKKGDMAIGYNQTNGSFYAEVPVVDKGKDGIKYAQDGSINWSETKSSSKRKVYFTPGNDIMLKGVATTLPQLDRMIKDRKSSEAIPEEITKIFPTIEYDKTKVDYSGDVNSQDVFRMKDVDGNDEWYSLDDIRGYMTDYVNQHVAQNYKLQTK